jgi:hypothetical protein
MPSFAGVEPFRGRQREESTGIVPDELRIRGPERLPLGEGLEKAGETVEVSIDEQIVRARLVR